MAEWSATSLAAQAYATAAAEQARAANWRPRDFPTTNGFGTMDELPPQTNIVGGTNLVLDIPNGISGTPGSAFYVTNILTITTLSSSPPLRQIRSDAIWSMTAGGKLFTNTFILVRAPDQ
jgi:hypothetical protein